MKKYRPDEIVPKEVVFLMDTSGSQRGYPILQCQELMRRFINGLNPDDTFTIIDFASTTTRLSEQPLANTRENRDRDAGRHQGSVEISFAEWGATAEYCHAYRCNRR